MGNYSCRFTIGFDPFNQQVINQIPGAFYSGNGAEEEFFILPSGLEGDYQITTIGTDAGQFAVSGHFADAQVTGLIGVVSGTTTIGQIQHHIIRYAPKRQSLFFPLLVK